MVNAIKRIVGTSSREREKEQIYDRRYLMLSFIERFSHRRSKALYIVCVKNKNDKDLRKKLQAYHWRKNYRFLFQILKYNILPEKIGIGEFLHPCASTHDYDVMYSPCAEWQ